MKRCPQCEFIYEDDQSLCDMDGVLLVFDSRTLPHLHALATVPATPERAQTRRNRAVPAFATLILALVLGMVYYVSTQSSASTNSFTPPSTAAGAVNPVPELTPEPPPAPTAEVSQPPVVEEPKPEPAKAVKEPAPAPAKKATKATTGTNTKSSNEPKKEDDSKVGSILKKTGRILKKPFKF